MTRARRTAVRTKAAGYVIRATYEGGPYIDLHFGDESAAFDVINVWDYAAGKARIPNTSATVRATLIEWRDEYGDSLAHDLAEYRLMMR